MPMPICMVAAILGLPVFETPIGMEIGIDICCIIGFIPFGSILYGLIFPSRYFEAIL